MDSIAGPKVSQKRTTFDQIELTLSDGSLAKLAELDQAVFPVLKFFQWMISRRNPAAPEVIQMTVL